MGEILEVDPSRITDYRSYAKPKAICMRWGKLDSVRVEEVRLLNSSSDGTDCLDSPPSGKRH
jgi:hypothetical protein